MKTTLHILAALTAAAHALNGCVSLPMRHAMGNGGTAISANIAIGCTVLGTGTVNSPQKHLGTP